MAIVIGTACDLATIWRYCAPWLPGSHTVLAVVTYTPRHIVSCSSRLFSATASLTELLSRQTELRMLRPCPIVNRRTDRSVRLVGPTIVSCKRFVRPVWQTVGRIKHVWFRSTADPTVEACGHYVRQVGPTGQSDDQSRCSIGGIITS